jgi:hypothetical protein
MEKKKPDQEKPDPDLWRVDIDPELWNVDIDPDLWDVDKKKKE